MNFLDEPLLALHEACALLPELGGGRRVGTATMVRWIAVGVRRSDGSNLRLKGVRLGFRWGIPLSVLREFIAKRAEKPKAVRARPCFRSPAARARACRRADARLAALGL